MNEQSEKLVLVTGATGKQGGAVVRHALKRGFKVRALTRDSSKPAAQRLTQAGVDVCEGDLENLPSLQRALEGVYGVFSVQNFWEKGVGYHGEIRQARNLATAAKNASVTHFVQSSIAGCDHAPGVEHFASKLEIEKIVRSLGLPFTFIRTVFFMENFTTPPSDKFVLPMLSGALRPNLRFHMLSVEDIGALSVKSLEQPEVYLGRTIDLAGDSLTVAQIKQLYSRVTGKRAPGFKMPLWVLRLMQAEFARQLEWNNKAGWHFDVEALRADHPELTTLETHLRQRFSRPNLRTAVLVTAVTMRTRPKRYQRRVICLRAEASSEQHQTNTTRGIRDEWRRFDTGGSPVKNVKITRRQAVQALAAGVVLGATGKAVTAVAQSTAKPASPVKFLNRNGVKLAYTQTGSAQQNVLLIHGWVDRSETLKALTTHFAGRYRVTAVDLRGHGSSDKPREGYSVSNLADDLHWMCQQLGIRQTLVVGHSLGGSVALELAARHPQLPTAVVALEGIILPPAPVLEGIKPLGEALRSPAWLEAMRGFVDSGFLPTDDAALKKAAYAELNKIPQHVHVGVFDGMLGWDAETAARACKKPVLYVDAGSGLSDLERFRILTPQLMVGRTVGVGHNQLVATPQQASAMIDRFVILNK
ncbi:MAG: alpha/beta fold hydrolase [Pleurocapsa sp. SU_196_0]|nr:alpha/beta fold hydrolase [Pleurocapsa sp. SU_196_0]